MRPADSVCAILVIAVAHGYMQHVAGCWLHEATTRAEHISEAKRDGAGSFALQDWASWFRLAELRRSTLNGTAANEVELPGLRSRPLCGESFDDR